MPRNSQYQQLAHLIQDHLYDDELVLDKRQKDMCIIALRNYRNYRKRMPKGK